jgi:hypothetical protein
MVLEWLKRTPSRAREIPKLFDECFQFLCQKMMAEGEARACREKVSFQRSYLLADERIEECALDFDVLVPADV